MTFTRRAALLATGLAIPAARAATWPERPVRIICPFGAGGAGDAIARLVQPRMAEALGQPVIVENRSGAGGTIGAMAVAQAPADGYTVLEDSANHAVSNLLFKLPVDYATAFAPVGLLTIQPYVWCVASADPSRDVADYVARMRGRANAITFGTPGSGSTGHIAGEAMRQATGLRLEHIPYRSGAEAARDLATGALDAACITLASAAPVVQSGRFRVLAQTGARRSGVAADIPTFAEAGFACDVTSWTGLFVPAAVPQAAILRLNAALRHALGHAATRQALVGAGFEPAGSSVEQFAQLVERDRGALGRVVRAGGMAVN